MSIPVLLTCGSLSQSLNPQALDPYKPDAVNMKVGWSPYSEQPVLGLEVLAFDRRQGRNDQEYNLIYALEYIGHEKLGALIFDDPGQNQLGIMVGQYVGKSRLRGLYMAGANLFFGAYCASGGSDAGMFFSCNEDPFFTVGASGKVGFEFQAKWLSVGMELQTNLNRVQTVHMPMLSIKIGKLWESGGPEGDDSP